MSDKHPRMNRENKTIAVMIALYCHDRHGTAELCPECRLLLDYSRERLEKCPFQEGKTVCSKCSVHCYKPTMREKIRTVMRYSGPLMMRRHPVLAVLYLIDKRRDKPLPRKSPVTDKG